MVIALVSNRANAESAVVSPGRRSRLRPWSGPAAARDQCDGLTLENHEVGHLGERDGPAAELDVFEPDWAALQDAADENPFMHAGVGVLKSVVSLCGTLTGLISGQPLSTNAAIRCGLMVRATKLCVDILADTCNGHGRLQIGLLRQLTEALANVAYLCGDDENGTRHRAYLYDSLISEREFLKVIEQRRAQSGVVSCR